MKQLGELFETLANVIKLGRDTSADLEVSEPRPGDVCAATGDQARIRILDSIGAVRTERDTSRWRNLLQCSGPQQVAQIGLCP